MNWTEYEDQSDIITAELGDVKQIINTACTVESVIRGERVDPHDLCVQTRAAEIILTGVGAELREIAESSRETEKSSSA